MDYINEYGKVIKIPVKENRYMAERESNRRKENTARQGVPVEDLKPFARFLLPKLQVFYETEEGQRAFQEWKKETMIKTSYCIE